MSYKALLFCPDEAAARLVTQVLSELEFTVELSFEPFVTVKKLSEEHFDALVVDCNDEQNASLLFKGARSSNLNHSSLCVAVVDGQVGLAKAFKIGANLVLTKPINVEQSKNTLRVARGLLRKNVSPARVAPEGTDTTGLTHSSATSAPMPAAQRVSNEHSSAVPASFSQPAARPAMPSTLLEAQQEKASVAQSHTPAPLESKSHVAANIAPAPSHVAGFGTTPSASGYSGSAAAPALAPDRTSQPYTRAAETKIAPEIRSAPPLASHDQIQSTYEVKPDLTHDVDLAPHPQHRAAPSGSSKKTWLVPVIVIIVFAGGYFGWQKFQPLHYIKSKPTASTPQAGPSAEQTSEAGAKPSAMINAGTTEQQTIPSSSPDAAVNGAGATSSSANAPEGFRTKETIDVGVPAEKSEPAITVVAKPEPLQVNRKPMSASVGQQQPAPAPAPPALVLPESSMSDSALAGIVATNVVVPKPTSGTLQISQGITQGLLIKKTAPVYPSSALQLRKQGSVDLLATIGKTGTISKIRVISGDPTLARSAVDAVRQWKYRPYLLNDEPVAIETQITIIFRLPN
jgi:TonB family protein